MDKMQLSVLQSLPKPEDHVYTQEIFTGSRISKVPRPFTDYPASLVGSLIPGWSVLLFKGKERRVKGREHSFGMHKA